MLELSGIQKEFLNLTGLTKIEAANWNNLLTKSAKDIEAMLDSEVDIIQEYPRLCFVAAALAYYRYTLSSMSVYNVSNFQAGDIKIDHDSGNMVNTAREIKEDALNSIKDLLKGNVFIFKSV